MTLIVSCWQRKDHQWWIIELDYLPNRRKNGSGWWIIPPSKLSPPRWSRKAKHEFPSNGNFLTARHNLITWWRTAPACAHLTTVAFILHLELVGHSIHVTSHRSQCVHLCHEQSPDSFSLGNMDVIWILWVLTVLQPQWCRYSDCRILEPYSIDNLF